MSETLEIERYGDHAVVTTPAAVFSYQVEEVDFDSARNGIMDFNTWNHLYSFEDELELIPYGMFNDIPQLLKNTIYRNPNIPGVMEKKQQLLWGQGPHLYKTVFDNGKPVREWTENATIQEWLDSFDYRTYLLNIIQDTNFSQCNASTIIKAKSGRLGKERIHSLEHINPLWFRLARKKGSTEATHGIVSDAWNVFQPNGYKSYPLYNPLKPFGANRSIFFSKLYSYATDFYPIPTILGALEWINRATAVPLILKALSKNSVNAKYHITSPAQFWDAKREMIKKECEKTEEEYNEKMLDDYERLLFKTIIETLTSDHNAGKIWHTKDIIIEDGTSLKNAGWTITPIDQNVKDFVETQIKIADKADSAVSAAVGIHKSLGGITDQGKSDSGSEQLYAYTMFKLIGVKVPEEVVTKAINTALKLNFPESGLQIGFYHEEAQKQEDQSSKDRVVNNPH